MENKDNKAKQTAKDVTEKVTSTAKKVKEKAEDTAEKAKQKVEDTAKGSEQKVKEHLDDAKEKAREAKAEAEEASLWDDAKQNIEEGARFIGEEARQFGEKLSAYSEVIFGKVKEKTSEALKYGQELTGEAVNFAQESAEKYRDWYEVQRLNSAKRKIASQLGIQFYLGIKNNNNQIPDNFLNDKDVKATLKEIESIDKEIIELTKEKEKGNE
jgi:hypothetical protein